jgi:four helix bundle protein
MTNSEIQSYRDLRVWQKGMDVAESCYVITREFPKEEMYGMISQIRRAAASIPANIASLGIGSRKHN